MQSDDDIAEWLMKRRANALFVLSTLFIIGQGEFIGNSAAPVPFEISA
jgi:hypothetical protein